MIWTAHHTFLEKDTLKLLKVQRPSPKKKKRKSLFSCGGPVNVVSLDVHKKLCGYQNGAFPLVVYGCLEIYSQKDLIFVRLLLEFKFYDYWKKMFTVLW